MKKSAIKAEIPQTHKHDDVVIQPMQRHDCPDVVTMVAGLARDEGEPAPMLSTSALEQLCLEPHDGPSLDLAWAGSTIAGFIHYYPGYDLGSGTRGMHLGDIYVRPNHRRQGIGHRLLAHCAQQTLAMKGEWMTLRLLDSNWSAAQFYKQHGAVSMAGVSALSFGQGALHLLAETSG